MRMDFRFLKDTVKQVRKSCLAVFYAGEASEKIQYAMNKDNIRDFVLKMEEEYDLTLVEREDNVSETVASGLLNRYIESIEFEEDIYNDYLCLFEKIKNFIAG